MSPRRAPPTAHHSLVQRDQSAHRPTLELHIAPGVACRAGTGARYLFVPHAAEFDRQTPTTFLLAVRPRRGAKKQPTTRGVSCSLSLSLCLSAQGVNGCPVSGAGEAGGKAESGVGTPDILTLDDEQFFSSDDEEEEPSSHLHHLPVVSQQRCSSDGFCVVSALLSRAWSAKSRMCAATCFSRQPLTVVDRLGASSGQTLRVVSAKLGCVAAFRGSCQAPVRWSNTDTLQQRSNGFTGTQG